MRPDDVAAHVHVAGNEECRLSFTCPLVVTVGRAPSRTRWGMVVLLATLAVGTAHAEEVLYERDIQPLLQQHCYECHNAEKKTADL